MDGGMSDDRTPCHPILLLPMESMEIAAAAYAKYSFQRVLASWVQDLLEIRRKEKPVQNLMNRAA